ncbi:MAG: DNA primase [Lentisphaeria bacterium]|nr:DNA primase [Lentisphaeria bacterium]
MSLDLNKDIIEEIRSRSDIVDVISSFGVQLKRSGGASFKGLCPFHQEKTPSFHVDSARQSYHCFGCGKGGDVFRFFMERENVDFINAAQILAARCGVIIPEKEYNPQQRARQSEQERLLAVNAEFSKFFCRVLAENPNCAGAQYLRNRGISADVIQKFKIGMAPDGWTASLDYGRSLGFSEHELLTAGIIRKKEDTGRLYDQFRNRVTFTIENEQGRPVGFSARSLEAKPADGRKYVNTPDTPVFHKGRLLYALPQARQGIGRMKKAVLCEGQLDAIAFHRAGLECAVAPLGTAFTPDQARVIRRYSNNIVLAFDADSAGQKAVLRAAEILLPLSIDLKVLQIPGGKDPDELYSKQGAEALSEVLNNAVPWLDIMLDVCREKFVLDSPTGRAEAVAYVANFLKLVENQVELEVYLEKVAAMFEVSSGAVKSALDKAVAMAIRPRMTTPAEPPAAAIPETSRMEVRRDPARVAIIVLLEIAMASIDNARKIAEALEDIELEERDPVVKALNVVINCALNNEMEMVDSCLHDLLIEHPSPEISKLMVKTSEFSSVDRAVDDAVAELRRVRNCSRREELICKLRETADEQERLNLLMEISKLSITGE